MPRIGNRLRKATAPKVNRGITVKPFELRVGSRNEQGEPHLFASDAKLRVAATKALTDWLPWCKRHNAAGEPAIARAVELVGTRFAEFHVGDPAKVIECDFDEHTGAHIVLRARKVGL